MGKYIFDGDKAELTEAQRLAWKALRSSAITMSPRPTSADLNEIFKRRPADTPGVLEPSYSWVKGEWVWAFKRGVKASLRKETGRGDTTLRRRICQQMSYAEALEILSGGQKRKSLPRESEARKSALAECFYGRTFGPLYVRPDSEFIEGRFHYVRCRCTSCGAESKRRLCREALNDKIFCRRCYAGRNTQKNSSTAAGSVLAIKRFGWHAAGVERIDAVGWWTANVGTLEFIENYADIQMNDAAREVFLNLHGEI